MSREIRPKPAHSKCSSLKKFGDFMDYLDEFQESHKSIGQLLLEASVEGRPAKSPNESSKEKYSLPQDYFEGKARMFGKANKRQMELEALGTELLGVRPQTRGCQLVNRKLLSSEKSRLALKATKRKIGDFKFEKGLNFLQVVKDGAKAIATRKMRSSVECLVRKQSSRLYINHLARRRLEQESDAMKGMQYSMKSGSNSPSASEKSLKSSLSFTRKATGSSLTSLGDLSPIHKTQGKTHFMVDRLKFSRPLDY
mmetsp:Transcript_13533/g.25485  ORF Transcript_13533/g.25485 Transcript_13533/m.25485 type:complete len:254 (+) Transcript_13533:1499-2260(+)